MTVAELIEELRKYPPDKTVLIFDPQWDYFHEAQVIFARCLGLEAKEVIFHMGTRLLG